MKKLYSLSLAIAIAATASAADSCPIVIGNQINDALPRSVQTSTYFAAPAQAPASSAAVMEGYYDSFFYSISQSPNEQSAYRSVPLKIEIGTDNTVNIIGLCDAQEPVVATIDSDNASITISEQKYALAEDYLGQYYDVYLYHYQLNGSSLDYVETPLVGKLVDGGIEFEENDVLYVVATLNERPVYYLGCYSEFSMKHVADQAAQFAPWEEVEGNALFADGWILPALRQNQFDLAYEVPVERSSVDPNVFRIVDPFANPLYARINNAVDPGHIIFNISNPDCVVVYTNIPSGLVDYYKGQLYCYNMAGYIMTEYGINDTALILQTLKDNKLAPSQLRGNVIDIPECVFGPAAERLSCTQWPDCDMTARITLPENFQGGIGDVAVDQSDAPVEYFNLQGQKVENPANGLYIRRQGNKAIKVIVK